MIRFRIIGQAKHSGKGDDTWSNAEKKIFTAAIDLTYNFTRFNHPRCYYFNRVRERERVLWTLSTRTWMCFNGVWVGSMLYSAWKDKEYAIAKLRCANTEQYLWHLHTSNTLCYWFYCGICHETILWCSFNYLKNILTLIWFYHRSIWTFYSRKLISNKKEILNISYFIASWIQLRVFFGDSVLRAISSTQTMVTAIASMTTKCTKIENTRRTARVSKEKQKNEVNESKMCVFCLFLGTHIPNEHFQHQNRFVSKVELTFWSVWFK